MEKTKQKNCCKIETDLIEQVKTKIKGMLPEEQFERLDRSQISWARLSMRFMVQSVSQSPENVKGFLESYLTLVA